MCLIKISKENAEHYIWGEACGGWHLVSREDLSVIQERIPPHTSEVRHYHAKSRQFFFVLSGTAAMELNGGTIIINAHEGIEVPPGEPHRIFNQSGSELEFIVISNPASHGDRVTL